MMIDDIAGRISDGDRELLDRRLFLLPSIRSLFYIRNGELYADENDWPRHRSDGS